MRCEAFLEIYDSSPDPDSLPLFARFHLASCRDCRSEVERFEAALGAWKRREVMQPQGRAELSEDRVMAAIRLSPRPRREIALSQWAASGAFLVATALILPLVLPGFGIGLDSYLRPLAIVYGLAISLFGSLFIGSHASDLRSWMDDWTEAHAGRH